MKKLLLLLFSISFACNAQKNVLYLTFAPTDNGFGLRYERQFNKYGLYVIESWGNYRLDNEYIKNHIKTGLGIVKYAMSSGNIITFSGGASYHYYGARFIETIPKKVFFPVSIDLGIDARIKRFDSGFSIDFIKREGTMNFGFSF